MIDLLGSAPSVDTPLALLRACHGRIQQRLGQLAAIAARLEAGDTPPDEALAALETVRAYFATSAVHHTEDEEQSLFPMLRTLDDQELAKALDELESEHARIEPLQARLLDLCGRMGPAPSEIAELRELTEGLRTLYAPHLQREETLVFPRAEALLAPGQIAELSAAMRARRQGGR